LVTSGSIRIDPSGAGRSNTNPERPRLAAVIPGTARPGRASPRRPGRQFSAVSRARLPRL